VENTVSFRTRLLGQNRDLDVFFFERVSLRGRGNRHLSDKDVRVRITHASDVRTIRLKCVRLHCCVAGVDLGPQEMQLRSLRQNIVRAGAISRNRGHRSVNSVCGGCLQARLCRLQLIGLSVGFAP
jgi:hypothetical protein